MLTVPDPLALAAPEAVAVWLCELVIDDDVVSEAHTELLLVAEGEAAPLPDAAAEGLLTLVLLALGEESSLADSPDETLAPLERDAAPEDEPLELAEGELITLRDRTELRLGVAVVVDVTLSLDDALETGSPVTTLEAEDEGVATEEGDEDSEAVDEARLLALLIPERDGAVVSEGGALALAVAHANGEAEAAMLIVLQAVLELLALPVADVSGDTDALKEDPCEAVPLDDGDPERDLTADADVPPVVLPVGVAAFVDVAAPLHDEEGQTVAVGVAEELPDEAALELEAQAVFQDAR